MILGRIVEVLEGGDCVALTEIARRVESSPDAVLPMLETLERHGRVRREVSAVDCGKGCSGCGMVESLRFRLARGKK